MTVERPAESMRVGAATPALSVHKLDVAYGQVSVLRQVSLDVRRGEIVALLGPNGAGKTTLMLALGGYLHSRGGEIRLFGAAATDAPNRRARRGLGFVGDDRHVFPGLTVGQNFRLVDDGRDAILTRFPELADLTRSRGALLSGGEQQMLAFGRALAADPKVLLVDELSAGLAPLIRERLLGMLRAFADEGGAVLVVEQSVRAILSVADRAYVLRRGEIVDQRPAKAWDEQLDALADLYLS